MNPVFIKFMKHFLLVVLMLLASCTQESGKEITDTWEHTYTVRGKIVKLPEPNKVPRELLIRHEAIDNFVSSAGNVEPMRSMTMPFPLSKDLQISSLNKGDEIEFIYQMSWNPKAKEEITNIKVLSLGSVSFP